VLGQPTGGFSGAALRAFIEPESAFEDDRAVATLGSATWMKNVALRELRHYGEGLNTRLVTLSVALALSPIVQLLVNVGGAGHACCGNGGTRDASEGGDGKPRGLMSCFA
jgi:hypothetical protein